MGRAVEHDPGDAAVRSKPPGFGVVSRREEVGGDAEALGVFPVETSGGGHAGERLERRGFFEAAQDAAAGKSGKAGEFARHVAQDQLSAQSGLGERPGEGGVCHPEFDGNTEQAPGGKREQDAAFPFAGDSHGLQREENGGGDRQQGERQQAGVADVAQAERRGQQGGDEGKQQHPSRLRGRFPGKHKQEST